MHTRRIVVLAAVLALLAAAAFYVQGPGKRLRSREAPAVFPGLEAPAVRAIRVEGPAGDLSLLRGEGGRWTVGEERHAADGEAVERLLTDLQDLRREAVASTNLDKLASFGLGEGERLAVRLEGEGGDEIVSFTAGKAGPDFFSGYLLPAGGEEVLLVSANLRASLDRPAEGWRDRRIVTAAAADIAAVTVTAAGESVTVRRGDDGAWTVDGAAVDPEAVEEYLGRLVNLRAAGFADGTSPSEAGLDEPHAAVSLSVPGGTTELAVGALLEEQRQRYLRAGANLFLVSEYTADSLVRKRSDFPPAPEGPAAPGGE